MACEGYVRLVTKTRGLGSSDKRFFRFCSVLEAVLDMQGVTLGFAHFDRNGFAGCGIPVRQPRALLWPPITKWRLLVGYQEVLCAVQLTPFARLWKSVQRSCLVAYRRLLMHPQTQLCTSLRHRRGAAVDQGTGTLPHKAANTTRTDETGAFVCSLMLTRPRA